MLVFGFLRLHALDIVPYGGLVDEVSIGYNAWSITQTSRDEHGVWFPHTFKAFGDYKLPGYIYLVAPFTAVFGPTNLAVRLPSALIGIALIPIVFLFLRSLGFSKFISIFGAGIVATSHWGFILSRFGFESHLGLLFWFLFLMGAVRLKNNPSILSAVFAGMALAGTWYSYVAYRLSSVVLLSLSALVVVGIFRSSLIQQMLKPSKLLQMVVLAFCVFVIGISPILPASLQSSGTARFSQIGILSEYGPVAYIDEQRAYCDQEYPRFLCYSIWNKGSVLTQFVVQRAISFFSPEYLFMYGDKYLPYLGPQPFGQFSMFLLPILYLGIGRSILSSNKRDRTIGALALLITIAGILPMALAGEPQKIRATPLFPALLLWMSIGVSWILSWKQPLYKYGFIFLISCGVLWSTASFQITWFSAHTQKHDVSYNTQARQLFEYLAEQDSKYRFEMDPGLADAPIYYSFYTKLDPLIHQVTLVLDELEDSGFQHPIAVDRFTLSKHQFTGNGDPCTLFITTRNLELPYHNVKEFRTVNGVHPVYYVWSSLLECTESQPPVQE